MALRRGLYVRKDGSGLGTVPADARLAHPAAYRQGVFYTSANASAVTGTSGWSYSVAAAKYAVGDGAGGYYLFANDGPTDTPAVEAAPGSGSRWDLIYVLPRDPDVSGTSSLPVFGVQPGASGGTPTKPYGGVPAGALVLAEAQVSAGATSTSHANVTITSVFPWTAPPGAPIPVRSTAERSALTATAVPGLRVRRLDTGSTEEFHNGTWGLPPDVAARSRSAGGFEWVNPVANQYVNVRVNFPAGKFVAGPAVTVTPLSAAPHALDLGVSGVETTGFTLHLRRTDTTRTGVYWTAIQPD